MTSSEPQENILRVLLAFWEKLQGVTQLTFQAETKSKQGWTAKGQAEVIIEKTSSNTLIFNEKGYWQGKQEADVCFSNVLRWTLDVHDLVISLEHLRRGPRSPVFLFYLAPSGKHSLVSVDPHLCGKDTYFGHVHFDHDSLQLNWRVIGPKKNEEIDCYYS